MLRSRILVALVGIPAGVALVVLGSWYFALAVGLLAIGGLHEYYSLTRPYRPNLLAGYVAGIGLLCGAYFGGLAGLTMGVAGIMFVLFLWGMGGRLGYHLVGRMAVTALGVLWIGLGFSHALLLRALPEGLTLVIFAIGVTWLSDTFAYGFGRLIGRRRLAPRISPGKTIEGSLGGLIGAVLFALGVKIYAPWMTWESAAILGAVVGLVGQMGDLFESTVKRDLGVKDSGTVFRGHGGVLDRFDSVLFSVIATYWAALLLFPEVVGSWPT